MLPESVRAAMAREEALRARWARETNAIWVALALAVGLLGWLAYAVSDWVVAQGQRPLPAWWVVAGAGGAWGVRAVLAWRRRVAVEAWIRWWWPHLPPESKDNILRAWDAVAEAQDVRARPPFGEQDPDRQFDNIITQVRSFSPPWPLEMLHRMIGEHVVKDQLQRSVAHAGTSGRWSRWRLPWS